MRKILVLIGLISINTLACAESESKADIKHLQSMLGTMKIKEVKPSEMKGISEVYIEGMGVPLYLSQDGKYLIEGQITDLVNKVNLTEKRLNVLRKELVNTIPEKEMIIYKTPKTKHVVTVFTDVDCGYCRKMHNELQSYFDEGIAIRYLAFPSVSKSNKMESVWCAKDPVATMTLAKTGKNVESASCENSPIRKQYELGVTLGVTGTPSIILEDGTFLGGYVPAKELIKMIEKNSMHLGVPVN